MQTLLTIDPEDGFPRRLNIAAPHAVVQMSQQSGVTVATVAFIGTVEGFSHYVTGFGVFEVAPDGEVTPVGDRYDCTECELAFRRAGRRLVEVEWNAQGRASWHPRDP